MKRILRIIVLSLISFVTFNAYSSAKIKKDKVLQTLTIESHFYFSGDAVTEKIAKDTVSEISRMWNVKGATAILDDGEYTTQFLITYKIANGQDIIQRSCADNFVKILQLPKDANGKPIPDVSHYRTGGNTGTFYVENDLGFSTTAAHEYGHALGLRHTMGKAVILNEATGLWANDLRDEKVAGIMFPRGTWVKPEFQYDPKAQAGEAGGWMNPKSRSVRQKDIDAIQWQSIRFNGNGVGCIGTY